MNNYVVSYMFVKHEHGNVTAHNAADVYQAESVDDAIQQAQLVSRAKYSEEDGWIMSNPTVILLNIKVGFR